MARLFLFLVGLCAIIRAENIVLPAPCAPPDPRATGVWEVGLSLLNLLPNGLVDFDTSLLGYGPLVAIPVGRDSIQVGGLYGFGGGLTLHLVETAYRLSLRTPFLSGFLLGGGHFLHYALKENNYDHFGANFGVGLLQDLSQSFGMNLLLRIYVQKRSILAVGGGFTFLL